MNDYRKNLEQQQRIKTENVLKMLPVYVKDYFNYCNGTLNRSSQTILAYAYDIRTFYQFLSNTNPSLKDIRNISVEDLNRLTIKDIQEYMSYLCSYTDENGKVITNEAPARARKLASLRSFMKYLCTFDSLNVNLAKMIDNPKKDKKEQSRLDRNEIKQLINHTEYSIGLSDREQKFATKTSLRDTAIITLFSGSGIRVSELVGLDLKDIDYKNNSIKVTRKGKKEDIVYVGDNVIQAIKDYIEYERKPVIDNHALFLSSRGNSFNRLTVRSVERIVKKYGKAISKDISCHSLRRSMGTEVYSQTGDLNLTANVLGHKNVQVTKDCYVTTSDLQKKSVIQISENFTK